MGDLVRTQKKQELQTLLSKHMTHFANTFHLLSTENKWSLIRLVCISWAMSRPTPLLNGYVVTYACTYTAANKCTMHVENTKLDTMVIIFYCQWYHPKTAIHNSLWQAYKLASSFYTLTYTGNLWILLAHCYPTSCFSNLATTCLILPQPRFHGPFCHLQKLELTFMFQVPFLPSLFVTSPIWFASLIIFSLLNKSSVMAYLSMLQAILLMAKWWFVHSMIATQFSSFYCWSLWWPWPHCQPIPFWLPPVHCWNNTLPAFLLYCSGNSMAMISPGRMCACILR